MSVDPKFQVEGVAPTNHYSSQNTRLNDLSYGIKIWSDLFTVLSQFTRLTDRRTDRILIAIPRLHSMQRVKNNNSMGQNIKPVGLCLSVSVCIHLWVLLRSHFLIDFPPKLSQT